ncbi:ABC transporter ATP-binding protein [Rhodoligotrophos ferricapiens]|uniref:ABC transporter ATP-binding protein n=1 Tax=Rhodoligotrophos ferricapiens TaxID=3069264 RepID=UPI00315DB5CA
MKAAIAMTAPKQHSVSLRSVTKRYGALVAIDHVSLDVAPGEFLSLLGPSGSGKSTILMAIAGFVKPDEGDIVLDGQPITRLSPEKRNFGVVFQGYALFPHMTVAENVGYPLKLRGIGRADARERVQRVLDLVHLTAFADRQPKQLSGGQQQRVALARALVFEPAVVLLDEPLSALDKKLRAELQFELKALHERLGMTFINVTHDQEEAMTMSDRIVILNEGRVQQVGAPQSLYDAPQTRFVADFLGRANFLTGKVAGREGEILTLREGGEMIRARALHDEPVDSAAVVALRPERIEVRPQGATSADGLNAITGQVSSAIFSGAHFVFVVRTAFGDMIAMQPSFGAEQSFAAGDTVILQWPIEAGVAVRE